MKDHDRKVYTKSLHFKIRKNAKKAETTSIINFRHSNKKMSIVTTLIFFVSLFI